MGILTDAEFNNGLDLSVKWVENCLEDRTHTDFTPTLLVYTLREGIRDFGVSIVVMPNFEMDKRHEILDHMGTMFGADKQLVVAIYFVTEAWISSAAEDGKRKYALPEQDPERREAISVAGLAYDNRAAMAQVAVTRNKHNKMIAGATTIMPYGGEVEVTNNVCKAFFRGYVLAAMKASPTK
jgi:hypothetical protein